MTGASAPGEPEPAEAAEAREAREARETRGTVLLVDDDPTLGALLDSALRDEGYAVTVLAEWNADALRVVVGRLEPDCVLLDGMDKSEYGRSWLDAAWAHGRARRVPVVMFTASRLATDEGAAGETARSKEAGFFAVLPKPFDLDELLAVVDRATGSVPRFDRSGPAEAARTEELVRKLREAGARDVHASTRREWANFYAGDTLSVVYWSERDGVYYVTRQDAQGGSMSQVGRFLDLDLAVALAVKPTE